MLANLIAVNTVSSPAENETQKPSLHLNTTCLNSIALSNSCPYKKRCRSPSGCMHATWIMTMMEKLEGNVWNVTISPFPYSTNITYTISAMDYANNTVATEELGYELVYQVIPEIPTSTLTTLLLLEEAIAAFLLRRIKSSAVIHRQ